MTEWREDARLAGRMLAQVGEPTDPAHAAMARIAASGVEMVARKLSRRARANYARVAEA